MAMTCWLHVIHMAIEAGPHPLAAEPVLPLHLRPLSVLPFETCTIHYTQIGTFSIFM
jgi:hypothetical protein